MSQHAKTVLLCGVAMAPMNIAMTIRKSHDKQCPNRLTPGSLSLPLKPSRAVEMEPMVTAMCSLWVGKLSIAFIGQWTGRCPCRL